MSIVPALKRIAPRLLLVVALAAAIAFGWHWWTSHWRPDATTWPKQGVAVAAENAPISWPSLVSQGAGFAYIDATNGTQLPDASFNREHDAAQAAGLRVGAIHHFALCALASEQAAGFVRIVPREATALPPAVMLDIDPDCPRRPTRALLLSELTTFLTQVETHLGKPAILSPSADFEAEYHVGDAVNRPLWLRSPRREPAADAPAWVIWQANDALSVIGSTGPTRWLVAHDRVTPAPPPGMTTGDEEKSQ
jgi:lysozyme